MYLTYEANGLPSQPRRIQCFDVVPVQQYAAGVDIVEPI